jgi:exonuclease SbcC
MRLVALRLRQWRCFEDCELEFPDGLTGIRGVNGAGKSTIAEAIGWALFGKLRHRARVDDLRRQGVPRGVRSSVELEFQLGSSSYRIERFVRGDARFWINGQLETEKTTATNARVAQELDLTWDVFQRTVFAQQKDVAALDPGATAEARKAHVERLLGLGRFKAAATRARGDAKLLSSELVGLRQLAPDVDEIQRELGEAEAQAAADDPAVAAAQAAYDEATRVRDEARGALDAEEGRVNEHDLIVQRRETQADTIRELEATLAGVLDALERRKDQAERLASIEAAPPNVRAAESAVTKWDELEEATRELAEIEAEIASLGFDDKQAKASEKSLTMLEDERARLLVERPDLVTKVEQLEARFGALEAVDRAGAATEHAAVLEPLEQALAEVREELTIVKSELKRDREHVAEVEIGGPETPCPICRKPYGDEYDEILASHRKRIATAEKRIPKLEARKDKLETECARAREGQAAAQRAADRLAETTGSGDLAATEQELESAREELARIDERLAELEQERPVLAEAVEGAAALRERRSELAGTRKVLAARVERTRKALDVSSYDAKAHDASRAERDRLAALEEEARALRDAVADLPHLREQEETLAQKLEQARTALKSTEASLDELNLDTKLLGQLREAVDESERRRDAAHEELANARIEAQGRSKDVKALRSKLKEARAAQKAIVAKATELRQHEVAADLLSMYRDDQARRAWPRLEQVASALLNAATDGRYVDIRLSEDYRLNIVDRGEEHELARFSGGEQDLANLCLRLAIADWVSKERNVDLGLVVLDEVFGSQDEERRQGLLSELRTLSNRFRQMLVITHLPEIADLCDAQLEVTIVEPGQSVATFA